MAGQESDHDKLIRIQGDIAAIKKALEEHPPIRHINKEGICDAYHTVIAHDRRMNQWIGFVAAISLLFSILGGVVVAFFSWLRGAQ